jgi:hypothetical protein
MLAWRGSWVESDWSELAFISGSNVRWAVTTRDSRLTPSSFLLWGIIYLVEIVNARFE